MSEIKIKKRDGRTAIYNKEKIANAIRKAMMDTDNGIDEVLISNIVSNFEASDLFKKEEVDVEEIQDFIENKLMESERKDVAKAYIIYRDNRSRIRQQKSKLIKAIANKLSAKVIDNQNANVDEHSFGGRIGEASSIMNKDYALNNCMSKKSKENHLNNEIYIHDLDSYAVGSHNCMSIPFDDLLKNGFNTRQADVRPARSINTAFQLLAVIFQLQSLQQFGGVSATHLDWTMVPYVKLSFLKHYKDEVAKDIDNSLSYYLENCVSDRINEIFEKYLKENNLTEDDITIDNRELLNNKYFDSALFETNKELTQAVEGMYHNLNTLQSRSGNQLPFTSINFGTCTSTEGRMVSRAILLGCLNGVGKFHKTSIFPCVIFQYMKGVNDKLGTPNYDLFSLALKCTAKRLYPNYANVDWSGNAGYDINDPKTYFSTMGCRTANGFDINGLGQLKDGRGNICPVTIILPTLAMEADRDVEKFMILLDKKISEAKDMLIERFNWICSQSPNSAKFMYENHVMAGYKPEEGIVSALKHGTLAIGQLALAETLQLLIGCNHTTEKGMELAKRIESLFKQRCAEFKEKYKLNFGVYFTPECKRTSVGASIAM